MNWNVIKERILKDAAKKKVSPLEYFISLQCEPSTSTSRGSELSPACLAQTFFTGIKEAFDHQNYVYRCPFTGQWRLMGREDLSGMVDFYIDLGIKRGEKTAPQETALLSSFSTVMPLRSSLWSMMSSRGLRLNSVMSHGPMLREIRSWASKRRSSRL